MNKLSNFLLLILTLLTSTSIFAQTSFTKHLLDGNFARANGIVSVDLDEDGDMDILGSAIDANTVAWWENNGSQSFTKHIIDGNFPGAISVQTADVNADGNIDVLAAAFTGNAIAWWQNDGNQNFTKQFIDQSTGAGRVYPVDLDDDGDVDVSGTDYSGNAIDWWENNGSQSFTKHIIDGTINAPFDAYPKDMDGDSDIDVVSSAGFGNTIDWFENDGDQNFVKHNIANNLNEPRHLYPEDMDGDNDIDVLGTQAVGDDFSWWENDGSQDFTKHLIDGTINAPFAIYAADLDDDGNMDIVGASIAPGSLIVWMNDGNQNLTKVVIDGNFPGANCVTTADVDLDGDLDILATAEFGNGQIAWYENTSPLMPGDWTVQNSGIPTDNQVVLAAVNENVCWGVTRDPGVSYVTRTTDGGTTWVASNLASLKSFFSIASLSADTAWIVANSTNGSIYNTIDEGANWVEQLSTNGLMFVVRFFDSNNGVCIGDGNGVNAEIYTTTNGGTTWTLVPSSNIPDLNSEGFIPANSWVVDNTIWAPTNGGSLYKSTNRGLTWDATRGVVNTGGFYCAFKDMLNGLLCGSVANVVKKTTDGGTTWDTTETKSQGMSTLFMSYIPGTNASYMICATPPHGPSPGSAYTLDNGKTWTGVDFVNHGRAAFVSPSVGWSWGGANVIYKWTGIPLPVENTNEVVQDFHLEQNYPNPFNPSTTIQFLIPNSSFVNLKVYDVLGNEVATLVNAEKSVGSYEVDFNAAGLSSGIYFYKLSVVPIARRDLVLTDGQAGSLVVIKKMILLK